MATEKLGAYILDHDEKSFIVSNNQLQQIEYSSSKVMVAGEERNDLLHKDYNNYIDFKLSFDELNFKNEDAAVEKLEAVAADISKIKRENHIKKDTWHKQFRITDEFDSLSDVEKNKAVKNLVDDNYKDSDREIPKVRSYERTQDGWDKEIIKVKLERNYNKNLNLNDSIISIHTKSRDEVKGKENYKVKPHIHLTINRNNNWGRKYAYLKQELSQVIRKHNLTSSHNVDIKRDRSGKDYKEYRILKDRLSSFSWVVNKHEEGKYIIKQLQQYERNDKSVKLNNVEEKLNRYIELGGSYDFARKLQTNLKEKLNFEIDIKEPQEYKEASKNIEQGNYKQIINKVRSQALNGERISEKYKEFAKEVLSKDEVDIKELAASRGIQAAVKNRGYHLDRDFNKVIDRQKINRLCDKEVKVIDRIEKKEKYNQVKEKIDAREYLNQDKLRKDLKAAGIDDCKKTFGASEVAVVFQGKEEYIRNNLKNDKFLAASEVKEEIEAMKIDISDTWKDKIADKIYKEQAPVFEKEKEMKEVNNKLKNLKQQRASAARSLNRLQSTCKKIGFELKNFTNDNSREELLDEINESSNKIKAGISILLTIYRNQAAPNKFKKAKRIAANQSKKKMNNWDQYFVREEKNIRKITDAADKNKIIVKNIKKLQQGYKVTTVKPIDQIENYKKIKDHVNKLDNLIRQSEYKLKNNIENESTTNLYKMKKQKKILVDKLDKREKEYSKGIKLKTETYKFKAEDSEKVFEILGQRKVMNKKIYKFDKGISKFDSNIDDRIDDCKVDIKHLEREKGNIDDGGLLGKITGKSRKAKNKRKSIDKKITAKKAKLEKMTKIRARLENLKEKRSNCFSIIHSGKNKLREFKKKTKESKVHNITKARDRGRSR
ncbi:MAG: hypothetical protein BHK79_07075 [Halanaerobium sp. MDAL1]|nr:MAG: hypothetical protein BHK79_07075 [Halanaerobium sp. MDAL1]